MNVKSKENQENSAVELVIEVGAEEFEAAVDKVYRKNRKSIAVPGFRKGHAPRKIIEGMYGSGVFYQDAIDELYPTAYAQAVEQEGLDPVAYPKVEVLEVGKDGFTFKALVTVRPSFEIGTYKGLTAAKEEVEVTAEDVENELKPYIQRATRLVNVEREAKEGDTVLIDFEGFKDGVPFEGGKGENHALELGSHSFIPGFEEGVVGMKPGDEKDLDVTFPEEYTPELAGKAVVFKVKVHEVKEPQAPVVDDEFAKDVSEFDTLEEFKKDLGEKLKERRQAQADRDFETAVVDALIEKLECDVPEAMVDYRADKMMEDYAARMQNSGIPMEDYLRIMGMTMDDLRAQAKTAADRAVRSSLALEAVAEAEKIEITDADVDAEVARLAKEYSLPEEKVRESVDVKDIMKDLASQKALELVKDSVKKPAKKAAAKKGEEGESGEEKKPAKKTASKKAAQEKETEEKQEQTQAE